MSSQSNTTAVKLTRGMVYTGVVITANAATQTFEVKEDETGSVVPSVWAASVMAGLVGLRTTYVPSVGTRVTFTVNRERGYALGAMAKEAIFPAHKETVTGDLEARAKNRKLYSQETAFAVDGHNPARDALEGELDMTNLMGVGVSFLTSIAKLQAGDLAKVEACLHNDMVRIVSQTFKHFSAFGNYEVYNDGRLNVRWNGTSYDHETWGKENEADPKVEADAGEIELGDINALEDNFRARFSHFIGHLGGFINTYVTDPGKALGELGEAAYRSGRFRAHVGMDGTLLVQSVGEIALERVVRIPVPHEKKTWDDPSGNKATDFANLDLSPLKKWNYSAPENMWHAAYQLRHYARWLSSMFSLARYRQLNKDWTVPSEAQTPAPDVHSAEADREQADPAGEYYETYATIRIMRDGSIVNMDGHGSAIMMSAGNVQVSAAKNLTLEAAGDINVVAGQDINFKARRSLELVAVRGGIILKARTWLHNFCEWGSIWNRSGAPDPRRELDAPTKTDPDNDPDPIVLPYAIVNQATEGGISHEAVNSASTVVTKRATAAGGDVEDVSVSVYSEGSVKTEAVQDIELAMRGDLKLKARDIIATARDWHNRILGKFAIGKDFVVSGLGRVVDVQRLKAVFFSAPTILGRARAAGNPRH